MLFLIGGAARSGKGMLARRLLAECHIAYLGLDVLKMGLTRGLPQLHIDPDGGGVAVARALWPVVREMSLNLISERAPYVFEGELVPELTVQLQTRYPDDVRSCFIGYPAISPAQKLHEIRAHAGYPNDWSSEMNDVALLNIIEREIAFSQNVQQQCAVHGLPFFDASFQFQQAHDGLVAYVRAALAADGTND